MPMVLQLVVGLAIAQDREPASLTVIVLDIAENGLPVIQKARRCAQVINDQSDFDTWQGPKRCLIIRVPPDVLTPVVGEPVLLYYAGDRVGRSPLEPRLFAETSGDASGVAYFQALEAGSYEVCVSNGGFDVRTVVDLAPGVNRTVVLYAPMAW